MSLKVIFLHKVLKISFLAIFNSYNEVFDGDWLWVIRLDPITY